MRRVGLFTVIGLAVTVAFLLAAVLPSGLKADEDATPSPSAATPVAEDLIAQDSATRCDKIGWINTDMLRSEEDVIRHHACADSGITYSATCSLNTEVRAVDTIVLTCSVAMINGRGQDHVLVEPSDFSILTEGGTIYTATDRYLRDWHERFIGVPLAPLGYKRADMSFAFPADIGLPIALVVRLEPDTIDAAIIIDVLTE